MRVHDRDLEQFVSDGQTHVFLLSSRSHIPFNFASHTWFVVIKDGVFLRWEVLYQKHQCVTSWGYLHKNAFPPLAGLQIAPPLPFRWSKNLISHLSGREAEQVVQLLERSPDEYPFTKRYQLWGPNSNTFTAWVLRKASFWNAVLPKNALGKDFSITI